MKHIDDNIDNRNNGILGIAVIAALYTTIAVLLAINSSLLVTFDDDNVTMATATIYYSPLQYPFL